MPAPNRVYRLQIETLSPLCILSGERLYEEVDFYIDKDNKTTYVINSNAALDLALQRWVSQQLLPEQQRAKLMERQEKVERRKQQNINDIKRFEQSPPRDPRKAEREKQRLLTEANKIKAELEKLRAEWAQFEATGGQGPAVPPELLANSGVSDLLKSKLLTTTDFTTDSPIVRYSYTGMPEVKTGRSEILACVKDVADRLYVPGSSLKGALRTILAWALAPTRAAQQLLTFANTRDKRKAADQIEQAIFHGHQQQAGKRVSHALLLDVLRTVHIGDSRLLDQAPALLQVRVFPQGSPITVEAIPEGVTLTAVMQIEQFPFQSNIARQIIDFGDWATYLQPAQIAAWGRQRARALIEREQRYFNGRTDAANLSRFYADLRSRLDQLTDTNAFLAPIGWGAGWQSKTLADRLRDTSQREEAFVQAVRTFKMKLNRSERFRAGDAFPATRKVIVRNRQPWLPLGWVCITIGN
ncbi:type III-A CRISPR-associated RAMP protein Csm5 [Chloroflexus sp.]|uniref:type III-A CRISPR-associated RAMP protein Csm5 n=1 Tax=Chloroflexus sp. TaxID=1904827 RepID=UPI002ACE56B9|nr:type III-A CRISPR-associated RAMP protein Csm5 [Chloroflexus sp.]